MRNIVTFNGSWLTYNGVVAIPQGTNPLNLPAYTMRFQFGTASYDPSAQTGWPSGATWTRVSTSPNVWDFTYQNPNWSKAFAKYAIFHVGQFTLSTSGDTVVLGANTSDVTNMSGMFWYCKSLVSLAYFDTSSVTNMSNMFNGCSGLREIAAYDTYNVTNMSNMFFACSSLSAPPYFDTSSVTNMSGMFGDCWALIDVPAYRTHNVTDMSSMFLRCENLPRIPTFNTSRVTDMSNMFLEVGVSLSTNPLFSQYPYFVLPLLDTSSVTNMSSMCAAAKIQSIPLLDTSSVTNMNSTFEECTYVEIGAWALYQQASSQAAVPSSHDRTFRDCGSETTSGSIELAQIPSGWK